MDDSSRFPAAPGRHLIGAPCARFLVTLDAELVGRASVGLGAGRDHVDDPVDPAVGIVAVAKPGDEVRVGDPVLDLHYRDRGRLDAAVALATRAIGIGDHPPASMPLIPR